MDALAAWDHPARLFAREQWASLSLEQECELAELVMEITGGAIPADRDAREALASWVEVELENRRKEGA